MVTRPNNILTPNVQVQTMDTGESSIYDAVSKIAAHTSDVLADKANKKYELDFRTQAQEAINAAYENSPNNPEQLKKNLDAAQRGFRNNAPSRFRDTFDETFQTMAKPVLNKATSNYNVVLTEQLKESSLRNLDNARVAMTRISSDLLSTNPMIVADATKAAQAKILEVADTVSKVDLDGRPIFSGAERFKLVKSLIDDTTYLSIKDAYEASTDKQAFLDSFTGGEIKSSLFINEKGDFVEVPIKDHMDIKTYEQTRNWMERDILERQKQALEQQELDMQLRAMESVKRGEYLLQPTNKDHQKMVDADWRVLSEQKQDLPPNKLAELAVDYAVDVGMIPTDVQSRLSAFVTNGAPEQRAIAADMVNQMVERRPSLARQLNERDRVIAMQISQNVDAGIPIEQAVEFADKNVYMSDTPEYEVRLQTFKKENKGFSKDIEKFADAEFNNMLWGNPDRIPAGMIGEYDTLNRRYYMEGGLTAENASKLAVETVQSNWAITEIGKNKRWMKYAPEVIYKNEAGTRWIREQLMDDILSAGIISENIDKFADTLLLEVAPETVNQKDPSYLIFRQDENGVIQPYLSPNGRQQVFKPDFLQSSSYKKALEAAGGDEELAMIRLRKANFDKREKDFEANMKSIREGF